jgi:hypothetical protein
MDPTLKRRMSDTSSVQSEDEEEMEMGVKHTDDMPPPLAMSPTHATGHLTPGHIAGKPLHDSPKHDHIQLPPEIHEPHVLAVPDVYTNVSFVILQRANKTFGLQTTLAQFLC